MLIDFHEGDGAVVDVSEEEEMHGAIPFSSELIP